MIHPGVGRRMCTCIFGNRLSTNWLGAEGNAKTNWMSCGGIGRLYIWRMNAPELNSEDALLYWPPSSSYGSMPDRTDTFIQ